MVRLVCSINFNSNRFVTHANKVQNNLSISVGDRYNPALIFTGIMNILKLCIVYILCDVLLVQEICHHSVALMWGTEFTWPVCVRNMTALVIMGSGELLLTSVVTV